MIGMGRRRRSLLSALLAALAVMATLPVPCACLPAPVVASDHGCCAPLTRVSPAVPGCCAAVAPAPDTTTTAAAAPLAIVPPLAGAAPTSLAPAPALAPPPASHEPLTSPPLTVRRL